MRILVTGASGMLGIDVCKAIEQSQHEAFPTGRYGFAETLDVTNSRQTSSVINRVQPDAVIHCAAYTKVDMAETERDKAFRVNAEGAKNVAIACAQNRVPLCAISTDYVFDGEKNGPYAETDTPNPINAYGESKLAAERAIEVHCPIYWIVRTSWLYGVHGPCFPDTILRAAEKRPELRVVQDQIGSPTYTADLAKALVSLVGVTIYGTLHITNSGATSWHGFAAKLLQLARLDHVTITPVPSSEWPTPARRPRNSVLSPLAFESLGLAKMRPWEEALADYISAREKHISGKI